MSFPRQTLPGDPPAPAPGLAAQAAEWVRRRDSGLGATERRQLQAWLAEDSRHAAAFTQADTARTELDWPLHAGAMDEVLEGLESRAHSRWRRRRKMIVAGGAAAVLIAAGTLWLSSLHEAPGAPKAASTLVVVEPRRQMLPDGSVVELKDSSEIEVDFSGNARVVALTRGTAHFQVSRNPNRPFIVKAAGVAVRAVGTAFSVELATADVTVLVTEGRVTVNQAAIGTPAPASFAVLDAGKSVMVTRTGSATSISEVRALPEAEIDQRLAWRIPRLEFSGTPLAEVVAMVNRHNRVQFVIADPSLENVALSGILRADKIDALVDMLESDFHVKAVRRGEKIILERAR